MAGSTDGIIHRVRHLLRQTDTTSDAELLARFVEDRDAEAFAHLVGRHGPMVLGVCRRVLRNEADAEDAFQATFLVLARRAGVVRPRSLLGNWLYGVAYRTALEARRAAAVRRARERRAAEMKTSAPATDGAEPDLREVLDRELAALPDVYRAAVILCDLEGLSRKDAAVRLGWTEGTLSGRLARARSLLASRLSRCGLSIPAAGLGVVAGTATAGVPAGLAESTARIGVLVAAGEAAAVASAPVAALTEGVMKAMLLTKLKAMATALVVGCAVLATTAAGWRANAVGVAHAQTTSEPAKRGAAARDTDKDRIAQLERERDELLKLVRELKDRLAKLEATQKATGAPQRDALEDMLRKLEIERAAAKAADDVAASDLAAKLKVLEQARAKAARDDAKAALSDLSAKLKALEEERAKGAASKELADLAAKLKALETERAKATGSSPKEALSDLSAKLKALEEEKAKAAGGAGTAADRVAALEDRVKRMEADLKKLLFEMERLRKP
jgi:RNA polymerase sigma factor (sigma-70 family)